MSLASEMMTGGISAGGARAINGQVASSVSAAGSSISDATELKAGHNIVTTVASGTGVLLPNSEIGDEVLVYNAGANVLTVYPPSGSTINQLSASVGAQLATNTACKYKKTTATAFHAWMSA